MIKVSIQSLLPYLLQSTYHFYYLPVEIILLFFFFLVNDSLILQEERLLLISVIIFLFIYLFAKLSSYGQDILQGSGTYVLQKQIAMYVDLYKKYLRKLLESA